MIAAAAAPPRPHPRLAAATRGCHTDGQMDAPEYDLMDAVEDRMWWYRAVHARVLDALAARPGPPGRPWLDAGCGTGGLLVRLMGLGRDLAGLEWNPRAAARAAEKSGAPVVSGDVNALPFPDGHFAACASIDVLCHRGVDPTRALAELRRVLAPGGTLVLNLPAFDWLASAHDIRVHNARRSTRPGAEAMLRQAGFTDVRADYWNSLLLPLMVLQRKVLAREPDHTSDVGEFPPWLDASLFAATRAERLLARAGLRYPAGGSVLAIASRPLEA
ncbi:methyltransferase family protein [Humitalea rosea]|uniref:Methyltransferase family protein n=2 Tax=Humitalea rosea TaxID=990373 RepID=A0A2W7I118_9PROT|nr:methyltransferase family protein [Humitalea rosea]